MRTLITTLLSLIWLCAYAEKYALLVQVTHYKEQATKQNLDGIPSYVGKDPREVDNIDVQLMEQAIRRFGFNDIVTLVDEEATREAVLREMDAIARKAQSGDVVLFYFTGHGAAARTGFNLAPYDAKPHTDSNDIHSDTLYEWATRLQAGHIVIVLDSCFHHDPERYPDGRDGEGKPFSGRLPTTNPKMIEGRFYGASEGWGRIASLRNTVIITASDMGQKAYQSYYAKRNGREQWVGAFTLYLSNTLEQATIDQRMTYAQLVESLCKKLKLFAADFRDERRAAQTPKLLGDPNLHNRPIFEPIGSSPTPPPPPAEESASPSPIVNRPALRRLIDSASQSPPWLSVNLDKSTYRVGERMQVTVRLEREGYLILVSEDKSGKVSILHPIPHDGVARPTPAGTHIFPEEGFEFVVDEGPTNTVIAVLMQEESDYRRLLSLLKDAFVTNSGLSRGIQVRVNLDQLLQTSIEKNRCSIRYCVFSIQQ
jgi:hypothetical protein